MNTKNTEQPTENTTNDLTSKLESAGCKLIMLLEGFSVSQPSDNAWIGIRSTIEQINEEVEEAHGLAMGVIL